MTVTTRPPKDIASDIMSNGQTNEWMNQAAMDLGSRKLKLHEINEFVKTKINGSPALSLASQLDAAEVIEHISREIRLRAAENKQSITLDVLRRWGEDNLLNKDGKPKFELYLGGDAVSLAGPIRANIILHDFGEYHHSFHLDSFVPISASRLGIVDGINHGFKMINEIVGQGGRFTIYMADSHTATRSPTLLLESNSEVDADAIALLITRTDIKRALLENGTKKMDDAKVDGELSNITVAKSRQKNHFELSINFIYTMYGPYLGHEAATKFTSELLYDTLLPQINEVVKLQPKVIAIAGGEDGDLRASQANVRGRTVKAELYIPQSYLEQLKQTKHNKKEKDGEGKVVMVPQELPYFRQDLHQNVAKDFAMRNQSKYHTWNDYVGALSKTGMENEVLDSLFRVLRGGSSPFTATSMSARIRAIKTGAMYTLRIPNLEYGMEGTRSAVRTECESIISKGEEDELSQREQYYRVLAAITASCVAAGLNQHLLMYNGRLGDTKKVIK